MAAGAQQVYSLSRDAGQSLAATDWTGAFHAAGAPRASARAVGSARVRLRRAFVVCLRDRRDDAGAVVGGRGGVAFGVPHLAGGRRAAVYRGVLLSADGVRLPAGGRRVYRVARESGRVLGRVGGVCAAGRLCADRSGEHRGRRERDYLGVSCDVALSRVGVHPVFRADDAD